MNAFTSFKAAQIDQNKCFCRDIWGKLSNKWLQSRDKHKAYCLIKIQKWFAALYGSQNNLISAGSSNELNDKIGKSEKRDFFYKAQILSKVNTRIRKWNQILKLKKNP
jgi:hypothetical protein